MNKYFEINRADDCIKINLFGIKISHNYKKGKNNSIYVVETSGKKHKVSKIKGLKIIFSRSNSSITVYKPFIKFQNSKITLGENCHIVIKEKTKESLNGLKNLHIEMHNNAKVFIGKNFYNAHSYYLVVNNSLEIGDDCMFSGLKILCGDGHKIVDMNNNSVISNIYHKTIIGNHVWIGWDSMILKNAQIPSGSIVGASSIVTKKFNEQNVIIAGNPAKIVKHNITWEK